MTDLFARIGVLLVVVAVVLPAEFSDSTVDALVLVLGAYGVLLAVLVVAELSGVDTLGSSERVGTEERR